MRLVTLAAVALMALPSVAQAQYRGHGGYAPVQRHYGYAPRPAPHYYGGRGYGYRPAPYYYNNRGYNYGGAVAAGIGLGVLGAILASPTYSAPAPAYSCYRQFVGYDAYGNQLFRTVCP